VHKRRCAFPQGGQQATGQGPVAMAFSCAVFRVIDRLPPVNRASARGLGEE
jgi:hypothetical protein